MPGIGHRSYSLCGDPAGPRSWEVAVKREPASRGGSAWLYERRQGDELAASMPRCTFPIAAGARRHVLIAGGIGVTAFLAMAHVLERQGADWTLHVLARGEAPCLGTLFRWRDRGRAIVHDTGLRSRPDWMTLLGPAEDGVHAYCCGPESMIAGFQAATATWPPGTASIEHFVPPAIASSDDAKSYVLRRAATGSERRVDPGGSMLAALREMGARVDASCEGGICGACEVRWLEGEPVHRDRVLSPERRRTHLMACVAQCASDVLVIDA